MLALRKNKRWALSLAAVFRCGLDAFPRCARAGRHADRVTAPASPAAIVHERGAFVWMDGLDGLVLEGVDYAEEDLPSRVQSRHRDQLRLRAVQSKLESFAI